ncbi:MAG: hypothetical protein IJL67_12070 [Oscillospiraceae bacterium]|nr:hypothetical protein [Oscillospiraceae bacterium]
MKNITLRKLTAFSVSLLLAAQNGITVISAADNSDKVTSNAASEETVIKTGDKDINNGSDYTVVDKCKRELWVVFNLQSNKIAFEYQSIIF